jgi:hypothetical protein
MEFPFVSFQPYRPLDVNEKELRLLTIHPGQLREVVRCALTPWSLINERSRDYETISYCWGDATRRGWITVNGHVANVPYSAKAALQRMRLPHENRTVWIDAISINQADLVERSSQVAMMGLIYKRAVRNLIHLGDDVTKTASQAVDLIQKTITDIDMAYSQLPEQDKKVLVHGRIPQVWRSANLVQDEVLVALQPLFAAPWFQ